MTDMTEVPVDRLRALADEADQQRTRADAAEAECDRLRRENDDASSRLGAILAIATADTTTEVVWRHPYASHPGEMLVLTVPPNTIERLVVHPGEMLVLTVPPNTSMEAARQLIDLLKEVLPDGVRCLVKTADISMQVTARAGDPPTSGE